MSSYLLAFIVSDFEYIAIASEGILHRVYARKEDVARTGYALDAGVKFLNGLVSYTRYPYVLGKMFSAAIPDFGAGELSFHDLNFNLMLWFSRRNGKLGLDYIQRTVFDWR